MVCFGMNLVRGSWFGGLFWNQSCKRNLGLEVCFVRGSRFWWFVLEGIL